ncbi:hypothetical protein HOU08_gp096 [Dickeya phage vB_DsoM_JA29]|uniref:Uncharacterized protein n=1 Tax=Dickeya phage vB_DsoM_JA29 TaxID=2283031 RepID=A0A384ZX51_9CAUD|nr:hypothetical protein HOU08_gp096 [Dickeya phage vB_DsoM_JA29]AXG66822.1 hypothetical protein JA29_096 [Dickeya phage vB_DsoM_JA29]
MPRFRVRNLENNGWYDCADTPMFIRTKENTWQPLTVDTFSVRGLHGKRWYDIDAEFDPNYDDPCINQEIGNCGGAPTSTTKGSGTGDGSRGPKYDPLKGYPAGYDLPDAARTGFGVGIGNVPPTSRYITRPGIRTIESYDPTGLASQAGLGTWTNPNVPWASVHSRGAQITETIFAIPRQEGYVEITFASYHADGLSVDVYAEGIRVASTCGKVGGRGRIKFLNDPDAEDMRIMIRVRTSQGANWSLQVIPPKLNATTDRANLALDSQAAYDVLTYPDVIVPEYIGTPIFPAPCHATVWPIADRIVDSSAFEYYHYIGNNVGWTYLNYTSWDNLDYIEVYHAGRRIASTQEAQTGRGYLYFYYDPTGTQNFDLMVRVVAKDFGKNNSINSFYYSLYCPNERGAREYRFPCQYDWVVSAGHPTTEDNFALGTQTDIRAGLVDVRAGSFDTKFEVFDQEMNLLDTENLLAGQSGTLEFWKYPEHVLRSNITVRVTSGIGCDWSYFVWCPIQPPKLNVQDFSVPYNCLSVDDPNNPNNSIWTMSKGVLRYWGNVDHTVNLNFRIATVDGNRWTGAGRGSALTPAVASTGGYFQKTNETKHGDLWGNLEYEPWPLTIGNRSIVAVSTSFTWTGTIYTASLAQLPSAANGWVGVVTVYTPQDDEQYVDLRVNVTVTYG